MLVGGYFEGELEELKKKQTALLLSNEKCRARLRDLDNVKKQVEDLK